MLWINFSPKFFIPNEIECMIFEMKALYVMLYIMIAAGWAIDVGHKGQQLIYTPASLPMLKAICMLKWHICIFLLNKFMSKFLTVSSPLALTAF